ncbi:radical SAM family heme chaperone HemW [Helicobacter suis]|uniref:radical SAM family heme chaperone HemW n=1 Tax=Helicobacter suis TaxID=104628 RepID=UPI0013D1681F|nr:radical SAM family heme chaperone HemW [Helicobacter suis]
MFKIPPQSPSSLYLHIPFCQSKCGYCAFNSFVGLDALKEAYTQALICDLKTSLAASPVLSSIFVGGGTPNSLKPKFYEQIFNTISKYAYLKSDIEITLEANPDLINQEWCCGLKQLGATRLSIGVQSFFPDKLHLLQRKHDHSAIFKALDIAYQSGFEHLSIDLIYNTPLDTKERLEEECNQAAKLPIDHLSAYSLTLEDNTRLIKDINPCELLHLDTFLKQCLKDRGFKQYEVSNYARDYQVRHNLGYWEGLEYLGCGAGAVGRIKDQRLYKIKDVATYIDNPFKARIEKLSQKDLWFESLFLGLRCILGAPLEGLDSLKVQTLLKEKICTIENKRLLARDFSLADEIALWLLD